MARLPAATDQLNNREATEPSIAVKPRKIYNPVRQEAIMAVFEDPIRALRVELPPGYAFDPFTSTLTDFYFACWNRAGEVVVVYVQPARVAPGQNDDAWLAAIDRETYDKSSLIDLSSPGGRAVAAEFRRPDGSAQRVAFVRGPRVDFAIEYDGGDPDAPDPWAPLRQAVSTAMSTANTNLESPVDQRTILRMMEEADRAVKKGDLTAAVESFRRAVWMGTATWLHALAKPQDRDQIVAALQMSRILHRLGQVVPQPGILRDAEYIARRAERSLKEMTAEAQAEFEPLIRETLDCVYKDLRRQIDREFKGPFSRVRALSVRAFWLAEAAADSYHAANLEECRALAHVALEDLLTMSVQRQRGLAQSPPDPGALDKTSELLWALETAQTLHTQYRCAMDLQDSALVMETAALLPPISERVIALGAASKGMELLQASALIAQAGTFLFLGDDALNESGRYLEQAEKTLDAAADEGAMRAQLCLGLGWNRFHRQEFDGLIELVDRGLAAAAAAVRSEVPPLLVRSLHALRAQVLVTSGHPAEALVDADIAITGAAPPLSTHFLIRAAARSSAGDQPGALEDVRMALKTALADNPLGDDVPTILFAASTLTEAVNVPVSLELTWAAQTLMDARRLTLRIADQRIAFDDAARHREVAETLVSRLIDAGQCEAALVAADRSRARSFHQLLGRPWEDPLADRDQQPLTLDLTSDVIADLHTAATSVRAYADRALVARGLEPALDALGIYHLVTATGTPALLIQPVGERIHLFLVRPTGNPALVVAESPVPMSEVKAALDQLQGELGVFALARARGVEGPLVDIGEDRDALNAAIQTLSDALIAPVAVGIELDLDGGLTVVPYRELSLIPFPLLLLPDGTPLVDRFAVSVAPSLATLALIRQSPASKDVRYFIAGDPSTDPKSGLPSLPAAAVEAQDVHDLLVAAGVPEQRIALRLKEQASEAEYRASARGCRVVHLACHAMVCEPVAQSALFLAAGPHDDGELLPLEIAGVHLSGALVFLSACQTGLGRPTADGVIGLSRAFLEAGARCVVMSMWKVADEAAAQLARHFYRALLGLDGPAKTAAQALRSAMVSTREELEAGKVVTELNEVLDDHPAHWAPFLLLGDGTMTSYDE